MMILGTTNIYTIGEIIKYINTLIIPHVFWTGIFLIILYTQACSQENLVALNNKLDEAASKYKMSCEFVGYGSNTIVRCINQEVICYATGDGISCFSSHQSQP